MMMMIKLLATEWKSGIQFSAWGFAMFFRNYEVQNGFWAQSVSLSQGTVNSIFRGEGSWSLKLGINFHFPKGRPLLKFSLHTFIQLLKDARISL